MPQEPLSIQAALDLAFKNNPELRLAGLSVDKAQIQRDNAFDMVDHFPPMGLGTFVFNQVFNGYQQAEIGLNTAKKGEEAAGDKLTKDVIEAYTDALTDYNNMKSMEMTVKNVRDLHKVSDVASRTGFISPYDLESSSAGLQQAEEGYRAMQRAYEGSIANLASLLGQHPNWNPLLTSKPLITNFERGELVNDIILGSSESVLVWTKKALLDLEKSKEDWILPGLTNEEKQIDKTTAELNYEDAKRTARLLIEQMYYGIDTIEGQIEMAELVYKKALKDEEVARLKYEVGLIPKLSIVPGSESLEARVLDVSQAEIKLDNLKLQLANLKSQYKFMIGEQVFAEADWTAPPALEDEADKK
jgi:outer membrane protein TolC